MFNHLFNFQTKTVALVALILGTSALISRLLGLLRDRLLAGTFGAGEDLDVYFAAFRIPDFIYGIVIMGGISAVFLPVLAEHFKKSEADGWQLTSNVLNCFLMILIVLCGLLAIFTPYLIQFITPGFGPEQKALVISLTRLMFLSPILLGLSSIFSGVLHYFNRFFAYAVAPVLYNLGIILGILFLVPRFGIWGLAYGVILGALLHWVVQIPAAQVSGFKYWPILNFRSAGSRKIFKLMAPRLFGASVYHINLIVITAIASTLAAGSIAIFNFANNIQHLPIGIVGASFALASFPALSKSWANGQRAEFLDNFSLTFRQIIFLIVPLSVFIFLLRTQLVELIFGRSAFGWEGMKLTAAALGLFASGIFAFAISPFLLRAFFALQDTKTPTVIAFVYMIFNAVFCFSLVWSLSFPNIFQEFVINGLKLQGVENISVLGLPLAVALSGIIYFLLLLFFFRRKFGRIRLKEISRSGLKIILASIPMGFFVYLALRVWTGVLIQTIAAGFIGALVYILVAWILKLPEISAVKSLILKQFIR